ncbi:MAG: tryptophan synthase subunit alpha [Candidatus Bathyarchaeia archaeon]
MGAEPVGEIAEKFGELRSKSEGALISYITLGDPTVEASLKLVKILNKSGADIIELGFPYSDPLADGPTIQASHQRALSNGVNTDVAFRLVEKARGITTNPLVLLIYYNLVFQRGVERFFREAAEARVGGIIIPDLPVEECGEALEASRRHGVDLIQLVAPTTGELRLQKILKASSGFIYLVAILGVTGAREILSNLTMETVKRITRYTCGKIPVAVGFGISRPSHVRDVLAAGADGVIVGSVIIDRYATSLNNLEAGFLAVGELVRELKSATYRQNWE